MAPANDPPDLSAMLQQAQAMQERMMKAQAEAQQKTVEATAGGGMVTVVFTGGLELRTLRIDPQAIDPKDPTMLQDLIIAAINQGLAKAQELQAEGLRAVTGGLSIPGLF
jgi:DNA-binding YbaB/EbfC family protein